MISGMYMGEVTRLVLAQLTREGLLFDGMGPEVLFEPGQFFTKYVSEIERCVGYRPFVDVAYNNFFFFFSWTNLATRRVNTRAVVRCWKSWVTKMPRTKIAPTCATFARPFLGGRPISPLLPLHVFSTRWGKSTWRWPLMAPFTASTLTSMIWWSKRSDSSSIPD